ncbi:DUF262 domain-containing protein [Streptomyces sp. 8ZJF_21]|uniref:DUF262 domain-containing protein n=1 Tax=Streptomyces sp. 8ZJF_21 TaxID=2903141 RepID=UPI001E3B637D|nr:DUF262 domain-containing protein [Streptomyces sp. 8ZJF_21]MCD9594170.1 DUF262 domain-containing protein [Streptomyces sp. 8ZJF_21]
MTAEQDQEAMRRLVFRQRASLLSGELIEKRLTEQMRGARPSDEEINERYDRGEIRIVTEQARYPLESITGLLESGNYKLDPEYQRRHRWTVGQKSRLVESFIMNVPVPPIFLYEYDFNRYEVMDGLQRLTALKEFYTNSFELSGLEYWTELEGMRYSQLPSRIKDGISRRYLSSIVLLKETTHGGEDPERLKRFVFGRINTGGVQLSHQEVRNALYDGPMNVLCKSLAETPALRRLWGIPENVEELVGVAAVGEEELENSTDLSVAELGEAADIPRAWREMTDVELVLRFFANRQRLIVYRDNIRDYLDAYLRAANDFEPHTLARLKGIFLETINLAEEIFGEQAFRRYRVRSWTTVPYVSIYDAVMNVLSRLLERNEELRLKRDQIRDGLPHFYQEHSRVFNLRGQKRPDLMTREIELEKYLRSFIDAES